MKLLCRYANDETCSLTSYVILWENVCMPPCISLEVSIFPKFVRTYGTCMHHDKSLFKYLHCSSTYKSLTRLCNSYPLWLVSQKLHMLLVQMVAPAGCENFLMMFETLALLWRVLHYAGYYELPLYYWNEVYLEGQPWYEVQQTIPTRNQEPFWLEWRAESKGRTPWEAAQVGLLRCWVRFVSSTGMSLPIVLLVLFLGWIHPQQCGHNATTMRWSKTEMSGQIVLVPLWSQCL